MEKVITDQIKEKIAAVAKVEVEEVKLEHPEREEFGDYSSNIALAMFSKFKTLNSKSQINSKFQISNFKSPGELAQKIAESIKPDELIAKVEVAGGGFLNIWLQKAYLVRELERVITQGWDYGKQSTGQGRRVIIDYSAPNIARRFSVGHLRSTIIGQALYNIYNFLGYKTIGDNHLGDWGTQFGKLIYMIITEKPNKLTVDKLEEIYVEFHERVKTDPKIEDEGRKWFKKLEDGDKEARQIWQECVRVSLEEFNRIYEILGVRIDEAYGESFYEDKMAVVIEEAKEQGVARESKGAWVIEIEGLDTPLMLVKSDGGTTYATRDLATLRFRGDKWNPEIVIYEVGAEQTLHFQQLFAVARRMGYIRQETQLVHTRHGLYLGPDGKRFRTREGKTVKLEQVLEEAVERARKLGNTDQARAVGVGAVKYYDLMHNIQSDIIFDWEKIMNLEGNSGPYLQYTYARTQSVLAKAQRTKREALRNGVNGLELHPEEEKIIRWVYRFGEVVEEAAGRYAPNLLCNYLFELAQRFNTFYNKYSILSAQGPGEREFRLVLTAAVGQVLKNGLNLLGIEAPERM